METTPQTAGRQRAHRSAVSNGRRLFVVDGLDGRAQTARRFRDLVETIGNDLGGADRLSEGQRQLARRAATLSIMAEAMEADVVRNLPFDRRSRKSPRKSRGQHSSTALMGSSATGSAAASSGSVLSARRGT